MEQTITAKEIQVGDRIRISPKDETPRYRTVHAVEIDNCLGVVNVVAWNEEDQKRGLRGRFQVGQDTEIDVCRD
jgi:hypothetical protein